LRPDPFVLDPFVLDGGISMTTREKVTVSLPKEIVSTLREERP